MGLLVSLHQTRKGLKAAVGGVRLAKQGVDAARQANAIARDGLDMAAMANDRAARANGIALQAHEAALDNLRVVMDDFNERMRPRCVVMGISLGDGWMEAVRAGGTLPMIMEVKNIGGATGRQLLVHIRRFSFHGIDGQVLAETSRTLRLAPLRAGQERAEKMVVPAVTIDADVHGVTVAGRIGAMGDRISDLAELTLVEEFTWREDPLHRSSPDLVERVSGEDGRHDEQRRPYAPEPPALGAD